MAWAVDYLLAPVVSRIISDNQTYLVPNGGKNLEAFAGKYNTGMLLLLEANSTVDLFLPKSESEITIPSQMILPDDPRKEIIINPAELRLYYYPSGQNRVEVYPIGIGKTGRETPIMVTDISQRIPNPIWTLAANIRVRAAAQGITLPVVISAGANNPLGCYAMRCALKKAAVSFLFTAPIFETVLDYA